MSTRAMVRWLLVLQAAVATALGLVLVRLGATGSWPLALAGGAALVLLVRAAITANNFLMTARFASVTPEDFRLGMLARLRLFGEEFMATLLQSSWFMALSTPSERIYTESHKLPVLMLHGYGSNSGYWAHLTPLLDAAQISHAALDLEPVLGDIDDYMPMVARACASLCTKTNAPQVVIVAHSMGGLVARALLRTPEQLCVAHIFTIGTPHHGTSMASFAPGRNAAQMRRVPGNDAPESGWLQALAGGESAAARSRVTSLFTHHDNIVAPQTSSYLPGARNIEFGGVGHVAMGRNPRVLARLMQELVSSCTR